VVRAQIDKHYTGVVSSSLPNMDKLVLLDLQNNNLTPKIPHFKPSIKGAGLSLVSHGEWRNIGIVIAALSVVLLF
jgi:hypothetical protein